MAVLPYFHCTFLFSLGCLIDLMSDCTAKKQQGEVKPNRGQGNSYLLIYVSISVFIHYPLCLLGSQLRAAFRSNCEQHDNCISVAHRNQTKHKMCMEQIHFLP